MAAGLSLLYADEFGTGLVVLSAATGGPLQKACGRGLNPPVSSKFRVVWVGEVAEAQRGAAQVFEAGR